jgi:hypothetical protein
VVTKDGGYQGRVNTDVATTRCVVIRTAPLNANSLVSLQKNFTTLLRVNPWALTARLFAVMMLKKKCESSLTAATSTVYHSSLSILGPCHLCVCQPAPHHQQLLDRADYAGRFLAIGGLTNGTTLAHACNTRGLSGPILAAPLRSRSIPTVALFLLTICCVRIIDKDGDTDITDLQPSSRQIKLCRRLVRERSSRDSQS